MKKYLRPVEKSDMELIYEWANDAGVRQNSFHTHTITHEEHVKWFSDRVEKGGWYIYIVDEKTAGQVRFDINGEAAVISYMLAAPFRGKGLGGDMLNMAQKRLKEDYPSVKEVIAEVKTGNTASHKIFEKAGFAPFSTQYRRKLT